MNIFNRGLVVDPQDPVLHLKCKPVKSFQDPETIMIVQKMKDIQLASRGIGLAANQIGISRQIVTCYHEGLNEILDFINPRIVKAKQEDDNVYWDKEGCLSHPGIVGEVARYRTIEIIAATLKAGKEQRFVISGLMSRIMQHEIDHLNGLLFTDLGKEVRKIDIDMEGQQKLIEATVHTIEHGYTAEIDPL